MRVNELFADELAKVVLSADLLWVHDYHFIPLGDKLRKRGLTNRIGFFLHVPFPAPEFITVLPHHERLLSSLLQYDLIGFQTDGDVQNFIRYVIAEKRGSNIGVFEATNRQVVLNLDGRQIRVGAFPVGIDTVEFERRARRAAQSSFVKEVVESLDGRALIIGVDRLDYSKGLPQRMEAVELFFSNWPDWRNKVTYLQIAPKSRSEIEEYLELGQDAWRHRGPYQRKIWRSCLDTYPLHQSCLRQDGPGWTLPCGSRWSCNTAPRRYELGGQGVCLGSGCRGPRRSHSFAICRGRG